MAKARTRRPRTRRAAPARKRRPAASTTHPGRPELAQGPVAPQGRHPGGLPGPARPGPGPRHLVRGRGGSGRSWPCCSAACSATAPTRCPCWSRGWPWPCSGARRPGRHGRRPGHHRAAGRARRRPRPAPPGQGRPAAPDSAVLQDSGAWSGRSSPPRWPGSCPAGGPAPCSPACCSSAPSSAPGPRWRPSPGRHLHGPSGSALTAPPRPRPAGPARGGRAGRLRRGPAQAPRPQASRAGPEPDPDDTIGWSWAAGRRRGRRRARSATRRPPSRPRRRPSPRPTCPGPGTRSSRP